MKRTNVAYLPPSPDLGRKAKMILSLLCLKFSARGVYMLDQEEEEVREGGWGGEEEEDGGRRRCEDCYPTAENNQRG